MLGCLIFIELEHISLVRKLAFLMRVVDEKIFQKNIRKDFLFCIHLQNVSFGLLSALLRVWKTPSFMYQEKVANIEN